MEGSLNKEWSRLAGTRCHTCIYFCLQGSLQRHTPGIDRVSCNVKMSMDHDLRSLMVSQQCPRTYMYIFQK